MIRLTKMEITIGIVTNVLENCFSYCSFNVLIHLTHDAKQISRVKTIEDVTDGLRVLKSFCNATTLLLSELYNSG